MRIAIIAPGSRGDVEPYIALGKGLKKAGHFVRLISHHNFTELVNSHGLEFCPVDINVQDIAQSPEMRALLGGGNFLSVMSKMAKEAQINALKMVKVGLPACRGMDLILTGIGGLYVGLALSEKLNLPMIQAYYIPFTPTRLYPSFLIPPLPIKLGGTFNRLSYHIARQVMWQGFRSADKKIRLESLSIAPAPFWGPSLDGASKHLPVLYGFSSSVIPQPPDWDEHIHITGYWFLDQDDAWSPPQALVDFLQAGPPPIYIGFGSMSTHDPEATTRLVLQALTQSNQRGIILEGWGGMHSSDLPASVLMVNSVPFSWLFPQMAAVVHHGGAGTTSAGLRAGVPSIVTPFFGDQPFWGQRVFELGAGPATIPLRKLTSDRLAHAINTAVNDQVMRQCAADLGSKIRAEDGIAAAVGVLQQLDKPT
jgi:sterol 3beta-glucosyltransferase